ncbi:aquaporin-like [Physella acuta]|uniref:aquaporin-like n=1 Tax=Physella acuta TaxID=109671 RepID=UPI0027DDFA12|nr:aquaporin-like [Physella acuta]XP_059174553.1 aquaporin-like [Physella acuta]
MEVMCRVLGFKEVNQIKFLKCAAAEVIGTATLVMIGCGSVGTLNPMEGARTISVAFSFGLALTLTIWAFGHVSGAHVNPAVSLGFFIAGQIGLLKCLIYMVCQVIGAIAGASVILLTVPNAWRGTIGATVLAEGVENWQGFVVETISTFLLTTIIFASSDEHRTDHKGSKALSIGFCLTANIAWTGTVTGGSLNPARSFGPAVLTGIWDDHWIYWTAPPLGGIIAAITYKFIFAEKAPEVNEDKLRAGCCARGSFSDCGLMLDGSMSRKSSVTFSSNRLGNWRRHSMSRLDSIKSDTTLISGLESVYVQNDGCNLLMNNCVSHTPNVALGQQGGKVGDTNL